MALPTQDDDTQKQAAEPAVTVSSEPEVVVTDIQPKQRSSSVWSHYEKPMLYNGQRKAKCKLCNKLISAANTTNLRSHINSVHKKEVEQALLEDEKVWPANLCLPACKEFSDMTVDNITDSVPAAADPCRSWTT